MSNYALESFLRIDRDPYMIIGMVFLHFGSMSLYFIAVSRVARGPNAIDVIAAFPKEPRQMTS